MPMPRSRRTPPEARPRGDLLTQTLNVIRLLRTGRWRVQEIAAEVGTHSRTVYRLLHSLERAGIRVDAQREGRESYYRITRASIDHWLDGGEA